MGTSVQRLSFFVSSGRILKEKADCKQSSLKQKLISDICLKQGMGIRGRAAPPHPGIYRVPPREVKTAVCCDPEYDVMDRSGDAVTTSVPQL